MEPGSHQQQKGLPGPSQDTADINKSIVRLKIKHTIHLGEHRHETGSIITGTYSQGCIRPKNVQNESFNTKKCVVSTSVHARLRL